MGVSLKTLSEELTRLSGEAVTKDRARHFDAGDSPITHNVRMAYGTLIANRVSAIMGREVAVTLAINSPWAITPFVACVRCGKWFEMKTDKSKRCHECAKR